MASVNFCFNENIILHQISYDSDFISPKSVLVSGVPRFISHHIINPFRLMLISLDPFNKIFPFP